MIWVDSCDFSIQQIAESGQCFRIDRISGDIWEVKAHYLSCVFYIGGKEQKRQKTADQSKFCAQNTGEPYNMWEGFRKGAILYCSNNGENGSSAVLLVELKIFTNNK